MSGQQTLVKHSEDPGYVGKPTVASRDYRTPLRLFCSATCRLQVLAFTLAFGFFFAGALPASAEEKQMLTVEERAQRLDDLAERYFRPLVEQEWTAGIVVGVIDERGRRVFAYGRAVDDQAQPPTGDTLFEIGSVTKVFTGLLLADMAERGLVKLDQPVNELLPDDIGPLLCGKRPMQLVDLATHTSGLPRLPANLVPSDMDDPYADYKPELLYACLKEQAAPAPLQSLTKSISGLFGAVAAKKERPQWEYSNLGVGLLGHLLERRAGRPYEELIVDRICQPLGMHHTRATLDDALLAKLAKGHDADGKAVKNWSLGCLVGAGGLRSSADDMLRFVAVQLELVDSPLKAAIAKTQEPQAKVNDRTEIGLNWMLMKPDLVIHDGMTGGYSSVVGFSRKQKLGVVVLANTAGGQSGIVGRTASAFFKALRETEPGDPPVVRPLAKLDRAVLQKYAGSYTLVPLVATLTVTCEDERLFAQLTGQPRFRIYPESETKFFYKVVNAQITFECDATGHVERLVLHQNGKDMRAARQ